jgi:hypothetical protein
MSFDDVVFPLSVHSFTSSPEFNTTIIPTGSGAEQRIGNWLDARVTFNAAMGVRSRTDLQTLISFFRARKGRLRGFLVKDMLDFEAKGDIIAVGTGIGLTTYQLQRVYSDQTQSAAYGKTGNADVRLIYKPIPNTVTVYSGLSGLTLLNQGGYGAIATANLSGATVTTATVTNGGTGYTSPPLVVLQGGGGTGATATASISGGLVTAVNITAIGSGYTSAPQIVFINTNGDYSIDYKTGLLRLTNGLATGHILNWFGEFYIPCRFIDDKLPADEVFYDIVENKAAGNIPDVGVLEIRDFN